MAPAARGWILGLGNWLRCDDGVGIHALRALCADPPTGVALLEVGTAVLDALPLLEGAAWVLGLDAVRGGGAPGTLYSVEPRAAAPRPGIASLHDLDLVRGLELLPPERRPRLSILGVEPACLDPGLELSRPVAAALPSLLAAAREFAASASADPTPARPL